MRMVVGCGLFPQRQLLITSCGFEKLNLKNYERSNKNTRRKKKDIATND